LPIGKAAKPGIEPLLTRGGKSGVFLKHSAAAFNTVFSISSLILIYITALRMVLI
jgi:hypothetical protein